MGDTNIFLGVTKSAGPLAHRRVRVKTNNEPTTKNNWASVPALRRARCVPLSTRAPTPVVVPARSSRSAGVAAGDCPPRSAPPAPRRPAAILPRRHALPLCLSCSATRRRVVRVAHPHTRTPARDASARWSRRRDAQEHGERREHRERERSARHGCGHGRDVRREVGRGKVHQSAQRLEDARAERREAALQAVPGEPDGRRRGVRRGDDVRGGDARVGGVVRA